MQGPGPPTCPGLCRGRGGRGQACGRAAGTPPGRGRRRRAEPAAPPSEDGGRAPPNPPAPRSELARGGAREPHDREAPDPPGWGPGTHRGGGRRQRPSPARRCPLLPGSRREETAQARLPPPPPPPPPELGRGPGVPQPTRPTRAPRDPCRPTTTPPPPTTTTSTLELRDPTESPSGGEDPEQDPAAPDPQEAPTEAGRGGAGVGRRPPCRRPRTEICQRGVRLKVPGLNDSRRVRAPR